MTLCLCFRPRQPVAAKEERLPGMAGFTPCPPRRANGERRQWDTTPPTEEELQQSRGPSCNWAYANLELDCSNTDTPYDVFRKYFPLQALAKHSTYYTNQKVQERYEVSNTLVLLF
jgi:hypothetical protein